MSSQELDMSNIPTIPEYFKDKTILITGGSGFMGQALVEKLLYSCPELDSICLLLRHKRGVPPAQRLDKLYSSDCFDRLRKEKPAIFQEKVHVVPGDLTELGLGLSETDRKHMINKVNVIFHGAASVRFNDNLDYAAKMNIRGIRELIELAKEMKHLSSFVHISTAYCNSTHDVIDERLYPPLADWRDLLDISEKVDDTLLIQSLTPKYLKGMPNTYAFTKQLAEHVVCEQREKLPIVIIRPSIVLSSVREPAPGWNNNLNGPIALSLATLTGLVRSFYGRKFTKLNYIPLDVCIRSFIAVAWARGTSTFQDTGDVKIYNCCVSKEDEISIKDYNEKGFLLSKHKYPFRTLLWNPTSAIITDKFIVHYIITLLCGVLPAIFIDLILLLLGKKPQLLQIQRRIFIASLVLFYYATHTWTIKNENFLKVRERLKEEDKKAFYYSTEKLYETDYLDVCILGAKKYLLKEDVNDMTKARAHAYRMKLLDRFVRIVFFLCAIWWIINTKFTKNMYQKLVPQQNETWSKLHMN